MNEGIPEGWIIAPLGKLVGKITSGGTPKVGRKDYYGGNIPFLKIDDITTSRSIYITISKETITEKAVAETSAKIFPTGTVLTTMYGTIGSTGILSKPMATNQAIAAFLELRSLYSEYLAQLLIFESTRLANHSGQTTQANISGTVLKQYPVTIPPLPEQQKIASILTSVDEVIEKTESQISKLSDLKKGMMQELLTKGIGHTEFKDSPVGRIPEEWEIVALGDVGKWKGGGTPSKSNSSYWSGNIPWVSPKDMKSEIITETQDSISEEAITGSSTSQISSNSLLMVVRSGILKHTLPVAIAGCDLTINQDMKGLDVSSDFSHLYIFHYLQANNHKVLRATLKAGNTVESLDFNVFLSYLIPYPPLKEQINIANSVESIASKIHTKKLILNTIRKLKKSLMQDLLTGKVRVKVN